MIEEIIEAVKRSIRNQAILRNLRVSQWSIEKKTVFIGSSYFDGTKSRSSGTQSLPNGHRMRMRLPEEPASDCKIGT